MGKSYRRKNNYIEKVIRVSRVSQKRKGGDQFGFSVMMVVGDRKGNVGVGVGKARDVVAAIRKGSKRAKRDMFRVVVDGTTIPFQIRAKQGAGKVLLKPVAKGTGIIAGGSVRAVMEAAGIKDVSAKILGSDNQCSSVLATVKALKTITQIVGIKGIKVKADKEEKEVDRLLKAQKKSRSRKKGGKKKSGKKPNKTKAKKTVKKSKKKTAKKSEKQTVKNTKKKIAKTKKSKSKKTKKQAKKKSEK
ncbi:MAG: 30S ribosomal protein S5 [Patescibacteria group bacterium]|nr:30S ribosomal protein S5 [Patescibacteria group bacterium]